MPDDVRQTDRLELRKPNEPSKRVAGKLGFEFWKLAEVGGDIDEIQRIRVSRRPAAGGTS